MPALESKVRPELRQGYPLKASVLHFYIFVTHTRYFSVNLSSRVNFWASSALNVFKCSVYESMNGTYVLQYVAHLFAYCPIAGCSIV